MKLSKDDLDTLQIIVDEAHNDATGQLFEHCEAARKVLHEHPGEMLEDLYDRLEVREILRVMAWTGQVFKAMELVDRLRYS